MLIMRWIVSLPDVKETKNLLVSSFFYLIIVETWLQSDTLKKVIFINFNILADLFVIRLLWFCRCYRKDTWGAWKCTAPCGYSWSDIRVNFDTGTGHFAKLWSNISILCYYSKPLFCIHSAGHNFTWPTLSTFSQMFPQARLIMSRVFLSGWAIQ